jgi:hypothetical protein
LEFYGFLDIVYARHFVNRVLVSVYWYLVPLPPRKVFLVLQLDVVVQDGLGLARVLAQAASEKGEERGLVGGNSNFVMRYVVLLPVLVRKVHPHPVLSHGLEALEDLFAF